MANHPKKFVTIIVEGTPHEWPKDEITYVEVVTLEDTQYPEHPERVYSVTYERAHGDKKGVLSPGGSVKVKEGMEFFVKDTGES
ncbi:MAG: multiubiquitin domain-containing protein [Polaromonas sp.]|nr:multiubiquitin domain-containing protein [Polaromonas sp.]MDP3752601.1 multiubiquitin domain-containing protein [Polaromonas sp.]